MSVLLELGRDGGSKIDLVNEQLAGTRTHVLLGSWYAAKRLCKTHASAAS